MAISLTQMEKLSEYFEERAAIYEYLANYPRKEAEALANKDYQELYQKFVSENASNTRNKANRKTRKKL